MEHWSYRSIIGLLNFLEKSTRPDIAFAVHQCARFSANPHVTHSKSVKRIARYLLATKDRGIVIEPDTSKSFECFVDADFCGNWRPQDAADDSLTARSRTGYLIAFAGCPILWHSKLQSEVTMSTTGAEYMALSESMRDVIPMMDLVKELQSFGFINKDTTPKIKCTAFEDNEGTISLAKTPKMRPRTKNINFKYHHFRGHVQRGDIKIEHISTLGQIADILTKPLAFLQFKYLRDNILKFG